MADTPNDLKKELVTRFIHKHPEDAAMIITDSPVSEILDYLHEFEPEESKVFFLNLNSDVVVQVLEEMPDDFFSDWFPRFDPYTAALMLSGLKEESIEKKLDVLPKKYGKEIQDIMNYPRESAGFLMDTRFTPFRPENTVSEVLQRLRNLGDRRIANVYVVDHDRKLMGKVPIQFIAVSSPEETLGKLLEPSASIYVMAPREDVVNILQESKVFSIPVVDLDNILLGLIRYDALVQAAQQDASEDLITMFGAGREEKALSKVSFAIRKRLPWLEINLATAFLAASVVGLFEETIAQITVLAVFLPVVAGQSGNTGSQALAVTMRGLALREFRVDQWFKVARKEAAVGLVNGVAVALTTATIVYFWAGSIGLAMVIAVSMVFSMVVAGFSGAVIPIVLQSVGQDPAQSSSIVLTTVTDIVGFFSFLGLATLLGSMLGVG